MIYLLLTVSFANPLTRMLATERPSDVAQAWKDYQWEKKMDAQCRWERRLGTSPISCFGLARFRQFAENHCRNHIESYAVPELQRIVREVADGPCLTQARKRLSDWEYRWGFSKSGPDFENPDAWKH